MKCLIDGCEREAKSRGLCVVCYHAARNAVVKGRVTWDQLVARGLALPAKHGGSNGGLFLAALAVIEAENARSADPAAIVLSGEELASRAGDISQYINPLSRNTG